MAFSSGGRERYVDRVGESQITKLKDRIGIWFAPEATYDCSFITTIRQERKLRGIYGLHVLWMEQMGDTVQTGSIEVCSITKLLFSWFKLCFVDKSRQQRLRRND